MATASEQARYAACSWGIKIASDNKYHYGRAKWAHKLGCPFCGTEGNKRKAAPASQKWETEYTYCCNPFVGACYVHGANVSNTCKKGSGLYVSLGNHNSHNKKRLPKFGFKEVPYSLKSLVAGDILLTNSHAMLYCGNGKVVHAAHHDNGGGQNNKYWQSSITYGNLSSYHKKRINHVWRYYGDGRGKFKDNNQTLPASYSASDDGTTTVSEDGTTDDTYGTYVSMEQLTSKLVSSENYIWCSDATKTETSTPSEDDDDTLSKFAQIALNAQAAINKIKNFISGSNDSDSGSNAVAISESLANVIAELADKIKNVTKGGTNYQRVSSSLQSTDSLVEAPFIELDFDGDVVGVYNSADDKWPNLVSSMSVKKVNGQINQYTFNLVHQIRAGEDPQKVDKLISKVRFGGELKVRYGDCESGKIFRDSSLVITNVSQSRNYASASITYTISATSAGAYVGTYTTSFKSQKAQPSQVIEDLLYNNNETSKLLLDAFPGMANKTLVHSKGLIPNDDVSMTIKQTQNIDVLTYINSLVGSMQCKSDKKASYFINYYEDEDNTMGGAYFRIEKMTNNSKVNWSSVYNLTVGYPLEKDIMSFTVNNSDAWSILKDNSAVNEYLYTMENSGDIKKRYSKALADSVNRQTAGNENWWNFVTTYPITATIVMRGLTVPVMIGDYINIDVLFYGQKHMTSGLYMVTAQTDSLGSDGFRTTLNVVRTGDS